jgi:hypothetical protein
MEESEHEALEFLYTPMAEAFDADLRCYLVALDGFAIALIQSALRYAHWRARWASLGETSFSEVDQRVNQIEECLMSGCDVNELLSVIEAGFQQLHEDLTGLSGESGALVEIAQGTEELEDDLANVWFTVKAVATILGAVVGEPPTPL